MRTEDGSIIQECLNGESEAFGVLVDKYREGIYAFVYAKLRNFQDAQDVTQEVFLKAYKDLHSLRRWESFAYWLYRIAYSRCAEFLRKNSKRIDKDFIEDHDSKIIDVPSLDYYREDQLNESVRDALDSLPQAYREVLTLYYFGGMNSNEIANALGTSPTNIRMRMSRAREQLKEEIIAMMGTAFEGQKLRVGFTFRVVEAIKRVKIQPTPQTKGLPWGLSLGAGFIFAVLMFGQNTQINLSDIAMGLPLSSDMKILNVGEIPVDAIKVSTMTFLGNKGDGKGVAPDPKGQENAFFMAPQAEGGTWTKKNDMPLSNAFFASTTVNGLIYCIGGTNDLVGVNTASMEAYDPLKNVWVAKAKMNEVRCQFNCHTVNGKIYAISGSPDGARSVSSVEEYNPEINRWVYKKDIPVSRDWYSSAVLKEKIYIIGGFKWDPQINVAQQLDDVYAYDPIKDKWEKKNNFIKPIFEASACSVNGKIYHMGGFTPSMNILPDVYEYDPDLDTWTRKTDMPIPRAGFSTSTLNGKIYVIGGLSPQGTVSVVDIYDPEKDEWIEQLKMTEGRSFHSSAVMDDKIYVMGGTHFYQGFGWPPQDILPLVEEYTPDTINPKSVDPSGKLPKTWGTLKAK
jgi:RNA polymerase sigma factor (sigma-70 family)